MGEKKRGIKKISATVAQGETEKLVNALALTNTALMEQDESLRYVLVHNPLVGYLAEDLLGKNDAEILPKALAREITAIKKRVLTTGVAEQSEVKLVKDGQEFVFLNKYSARLNEKGKIDGVVVISTEISNLRRLEKSRHVMQERIDYMSRYEAMAVMATGIAHEFNNLLSGIFGYIDLAHEGVQDQKTRQYIGKALSTIDRARELTEHLVTFAKGGAPNIAPRPLFPLLKEVAGEAVEGRSVDLDFDAETGLWPALFDEAQVSRVIEVLVQNAYQSMMEFSEKPRIEIVARNTELLDNEVPGLNSGKYVRFSVKDYGTGIPDETLEYIFEPYFSTKGVGRGLGLATVFSILQHHRGAITVDTKIGQGSTFHVYLPFAAEKEKVIRKKRKPGVPNTRRILFMDDDEFIRDAFTDVLVNMGYSVSSAGSGEEAVELMKKSFQEERFAAIILDLHVENGLGAKEVIGILRQLDPEVPVFLASGTADDPAMASYEQLGFNEKLEKPFKRKELASLLRNYMND